MKVPTRFWSSVLVFLLATMGLAQAGDLPHRQWTAYAYPASFEHISVEQGLSQNTVHCMLQDRKGFLWLGTDAGLNRYDGLRFQIFHPEKNNPGSLSGDRILRMIQDQRGYIWIATRNQGITILDPESMVMTPIHPSEEPGGLPAQTVSALAEDREGNVWIGTETMGLCMVSHAWRLPERPRFQTFQPAIHDPKGAPEWGVTALFCDSKGTLWMGSRVRGLGRLVSNPGNGHLVFDYFLNDPAHPDTSAPAYIHAIQEDPFGQLWLGGDVGPCTFDPQRSTFRRQTTVEGAPTNILNKRVLDILRDSTGTLWLACDGAGLLKVLPRLDPGDPVRFRLFAFDVKDPRSLSGNGVQALLEDRSGVLWISTYLGGLNKLVLNPIHSQDREKPMLFQFRSHIADPFSLSGNAVATLGEDRFGHLWIGTDGFGLHRVIPPKEPGDPIRFERFREDPKHAPGNLQSDVILTTHLDAQKQLWLGTYNAGLIRVDQASAAARPRFTHFKHDPKDPESLSSNFVRAIVDDGSGGFWVAFDDTGLNHFDPRTGRAKRYNWGNGPKESSCGTILSMVKDAFGTLWMATPVGLNRFNPATEEFRVYKAGGAGSLSESFVNTLYLNDSGILWVGTSGGGLHRVVIPPWDGGVPHFTHYGMAEGLASDVVNAILQDAHGQLWLSNNRNLCRFDPLEGRAHPFPWQSELRRAEFISNAAYRSASGELFFGSNDGLTLFHPDDIVYNPIAPSIAISDFQISNKSIPMGERMRTTPFGEREITITPKDSVFSFDFAALHYVSPEHNHYAYQMEGLDKAWNEIGSKHFVSYTGLPPGNYVLRVNGSNGDGVWSQDDFRLRVRVLAPWYKTWWFRSLLVGGLLGLAYAIVRLRIQVLHSRNRVLGELVAERTQELAEANEALRNQSLTDPLTGLRNRRFLYACMPEDIAQVQRAHRNVAANATDRMKLNVDVLFLMVDVDHFKLVNDQHGHHAGDLVLRQISELLRGAVRDSDIVTRWGGEEFLVVARNTARADASILPERIRSAVEAHRFNIEKDQPIRCECSLGFSVFPFLPGDVDLVAWEQIIQIADACLYAAKRSGRNAWVGLVPDSSEVTGPSRAALAGDVDALIQSGLFRSMTSLRHPIQWGPRSEPPAQ